MTTESSVGFDAIKDRIAMSPLKSFWQIDGVTVDDFVRSSTLEDPLRHDAIVLLDVEGNKTLYGSDAVEAIQKQPIVLHYSPNRLDH